MIYYLFLYEGVIWILSKAIVEFREVLDEVGRGIRSDVCFSGFFNLNFVKIWGIVIGDKVYLLIVIGDD